MASRLPGTGVLSAGVLRIALTLAFVLSCALPVSAMAAMQVPSDATPVTPLFDLDDARVPAGASLPQRSLAAGVATGDNRIDALLSGATLSTDGQDAPVKTITFSFYEDDVFHGEYDGPETGVREVSEGIKFNVREIFAWYSTIVNVSFVEVAETSATAGTFRIMLSDDPTYAYAYYPWGNAPFDMASDVHLASGYDFLNLSDTNGFQNPAGSHGYLSLAHEIGHAMGLKHPFDASPTLPKLEDNTANTIMSYTFVGDGAATPMAYDVAALQRLYGARAKNTGDDTYAFTSRGTDQYTLGADTWRNTPLRIKQTIWDSAGYDTIDGSALPYSPSGYRYNRDGSGWIVSAASEREASSSDPYPDTHYYKTGSSLAFDFAPEKFINSSSNDDFTANSSANTFAGYTAGRSVGDDRIYGASAADKLDLTEYSSAAVSKTTSGTDLVLGLGANGSVTLVDFYGGSTPVIAYLGTAANQPPVARISVSATSGVAPLTVSFTSSTSSDPDGSIQEQIWSFSDGSTVSGATASKTYSAAGSYTATLTVTDNDGVKASAATTVSVIPAIGSLVGTVTSGGQPLEGATVAIAGLTATTNELGAYTVASVPASTCPVTFSKSGYTSQSAMVTISHDQITTSSVSLVHEVGTLSGTVRYGSTPVEGVSVTVAGKVTTTLADGTYSITAIPKGAHAATYSKSGGYISQTATVTINTGLRTTRNVYLAREVGALSGTVTSGGQPLSGVTVSVPGKLSVSTNSSGVYTITGVGTGSCIASFTKSGYVAQTPTVVISANQTTTVDVAMLGETGTLSGTVTAGGLPLQDVAVSVAGLTATTTADGTYAIASIPIGAYTASFAKSGYVTRSVAVTISPSGMSASTDLVKLVPSATIARSPAKSTVTYLRKAGVARFTLSAVIKGWAAKPVASKYVYLQVSKNGSTWTSTYKLKTSTAGKASKAFAIKTKQVRYYRWYVPANSGVNLKSYSAKTKVTVK